MMKAKKIDTNGKSHSEAVINISIGWVIAMVLNLTVLPLFSEGIEERSVLTALIISIVYTVASYTRGFFLRRLFVKMKYDFTLLSFLKTLKLRLV